MSTSKKLFRVLFQSVPPGMSALKKHLFFTFFAADVLLFARRCCGVIFASF
jgi:hypothetical protein